MEERLLLYLEYHPQVAWYGRGDISPTFASTYKVTTPRPVPFTISYLFEGKAHVYLPDAIGQLLDGRLLIAEAGMQQDKLRARNRAKAEAARHPSPSSRQGSFGLALKRPCRKPGTPISCFCMPGASPFLPGKSWKRRCK